MQAVTYHRYGDPSVLALSTTPAPVPGDHEVRIRVHAAVVSTADCAFRQGTPWFARLFTGLMRPRTAVLGTEFAGKVESLGAGVSEFEVGDAVFAASGTKLGAHAQLICIAQDGALAAMPASVSFEEAAAICEGALTALPFLRDWGQIRAGQKVLINGASGSVGSSAVQLARHFGAEVTGVCSSRNLELVRSLGAEHVIDYNEVDFADNGIQYDIIFDAVAASSYGRCKRSLKPGGIYLATVPSFSILFASLCTRILGSRRARIGFAGLRSDAHKTADLKYVRALVEAGELSAVIDSTFSQAQASAAHDRVETKRKRGSVVMCLEA